MAAKRWGITVRALVRDRRGRILILRRSLESKFAPGTWELPGGKLDPGEDVDVALMRELKAESGLVIQVEQFLAARQFDMPKVHVLTLVLEARIKRGRLRLSEEHGGFRWVSPRELAKADLSPQITPFVRTLFAAR